MVGVWATPLRVGRRSAGRSLARFISLRSAAPTADIVPLFDHAAFHRLGSLVSQPEVKRTFNKGRPPCAESQVGSECVLPLAEIENMIQEAAIRQDKLEEQLLVRVYAKVKTRFDEASAHHTELQSQLLEQSEINLRHIEMLSKSLEATAAERSKLREEVDKLYTDLNALTEQLLMEKLERPERFRKDCAKDEGRSRIAYVPSQADAEGQPTHVCEMNHGALAGLSMLGNQSANRERLIREIMAVDNVSWEDAHEVLAKLDDYNHKFHPLESLPYRLGVPFNIFCVIVGSMLVFWKPVAVWYAENVAGEELPEGVTDISEMTTNQVGAWTWSWMEPMIGVATFVLLCCQFSRAQVTKLKMMTYGEHILQWRADRLARRFPEYDGTIVRAWAKHLPRVESFWRVVYEKDRGLKGPSSGL